MIIKARFTAADGNPKGREYTYGCEDAVFVDDIIFSQDGKKLVVTAINLPEELGIQWGNKLKYLTISEPEKEVIQPTILEPAQESPITELTISADNVIVVEQLPMIAERLREMSGQIDTQIAAVVALDCTPETKATIKKHRAALNAIFNDLEARRIAVKKQILAPYDAFEAIYKECVTEKIKTALATLDERTGAIDDELKNELITDVVQYFKEYALCKDIGWLSLDDSRIKVGLTSNKTALRREATEFIDRVVADIEMINTQDEAAEMLVEYRKHLNAPLAIKTVKDREIAIYNEKQRLAKQAEAKAAEEARQEAMRAVVAPQITPPIAEVKPPAPVAPEATPAPETETIHVVAFRVSATYDKMAALARYLKDNRIDYRQIPLKNIMEVE